MTNPDSGHSHVAPTEFSPPPAGGGRRFRLRPGWIVGGIVGLTVLLVIIFLATAVSLRVNLLPTDAEAKLDISGGVAVKVGDAYLLRQGKYELRVTAPGFYPLDRSVELSDSRDIDLKLAPLPGHLDVIAAPGEIKHLDVQIGDKHYSGDNPLHVDDLPPGAYKVQVDAPLYALRTTAVDIEGRDKNQTLQVSLDPAWAQVSLRSAPSAAEVKDADGKVLGQTPLNLRLEQGNQTLTFTKVGYQNANLSLQVVKGQALVPQPVTLLPDESKLSLDSSPPGAAVVIDGEFRGKTPLQLKLLPERDYQLRLFKAGYRADESTIRLQRNQDRQIDRSLQQVTGKLAIDVKPSDAQVWVDGKLVGSGSQELELSTVNHQVSVRKKGYESQTRKVLPLQNQRQVMGFSLLTEEEAIWASIPKAYEFDGHQFKLFRNAGLVKLGSSRSESERRSNEVQWTANLKRAFYVDVDEVTNEQYLRFDPEHSSGNFQSMSLDGAKQPVVQVTWQQAALYCNWLSKQAGLPPFYQTTKGFVSGINPKSTGYRLLTEAEWTWLAKMTASQLTRIYPWGDDNTPRPVGNFAGQEIAGKINFTLNITDKYPVSAPVGSFPANDKGIFDISGNVSEYLNDWYSAEAPSSQTLVDPLGPAQGEYHVIRGASWKRGYLPQLRLAYRDYDAVGRNDVGFRIGRYAR